MKKLSLFLVLIELVLALNAYGQWEACNNGIEDGIINCIATDGNKLYAGTDFGVFLSTDDGETWTAISKSDISVNYIDIDGTSVMYVGTSSGLYFLDDTINEWNLINSNPIQKVFSDDSIIYIAIPVAKPYTYPFLISTNKGGSWEKRSSGLPDRIIKIGMTMYPCYYPINCFAVLKKMLFATTSVGLYFSADNGENWSKTDITNDTYGVIATDSSIFVSSKKGVWRSTDNGVNWELTDLTSPQINCFLSQDNYIIAGSEYDGVFLSSNNGNSWIQKKDGLPYNPNTSSNCIPISSLCLYRGFIYAGTHGIGVYRMSMNTLNTPDMEYTSSSFSLYPNPSQDELNVRIEQQGSPSSVQIIDIYGRCLYSIQTEAQEVKIDLSNFPPGSYSCRIQNSKHNGIEKFIIVR